MYLWGKHRITGRWRNLQGPCDATTLAEYQRFFASDTLADAYARVPYSGFANDKRPTYEQFKIAKRPPR